MRLFWIIWLVLPLTAMAETAYVTDNLRLGIHQAEDTSDRAFRMLESGQPLEVLYRDGSYAAVQLPSGVQYFGEINDVLQDNFNFPLFINCLGAYIFRVNCLPLLTKLCITAG